MASQTNQLYTAISTFVLATWTDVLASQVWEADHIENIPWESTDLILPYVVIAIQTLPKGHEWGLTNQVYLPNVEIYKVVTVDGPLSSLRDDLDLLDKAFLANTNPLSFGQVLSVEEQTWSSLLPPNQLFISKRMLHRAGRLTVKCLFGRVIGT